MLAPVEQYDARIAQAYRYIASNILPTKLAVRDVKIFYKNSSQKFSFINVVNRQTKSPKHFCKGLEECL